MGADRFNMQLRFVLLVLLPLFAVAKNELVLKVENVPTAKSKLAVFWQSELHHHHVEKLNVILKPNAMTGILATSGHKFVLRTQDFKISVRVTVETVEITESNRFPYEITFQNLNGALGVEMKLGTKEYLWIHSNESTSRLTNDFAFEIRQNEKRVAFVSLHPTHKGMWQSEE